MRWLGKTHPVLVSGLLATAFAVIGSCLFAVSVSSSVRSSNYMFVFMMAGRLFAGVSTGSSRGLITCFYVPVTKVKLAVFCSVCLSLLIYVVVFFNKK